MIIKLRSQICVKKVEIFFSSIFSLFKDDLKIIEVTRILQNLEIFFVYFLGPISRILNWPYSKVTGTVLHHLLYFQCFLWGQLQDFLLATRSFCWSASKYVNKIAYFYVFSRFRNIKNTLLVLILFKYYCWFLSNENLNGILFYLRNKYSERIAHNQWFITII